MPDIIVNGAVVEDQWQRLDDEAALPAGPIIVSLKRWQSERDALLARGETGVVLAADESPKLLGDDVSRLPLIAVDFPAFADGRGFSYGRELREQHKFTGELRATGQFIRDQLYYLQRCGFNAFALEQDNLKEALTSLRPISESYQAAIDQPLPLFRRRA